jgi:DNA-binding MarR family transcriptional regulator
MAALINEYATSRAGIIATLLKQLTSTLLAAASVGDGNCRMKYVRWQILASGGNLTCVEGDPLNDPYMQAWAQVVRAVQQVTGALEQTARDGAGMPLTWFEVLLRLKAAPGRRQRMTDLACSVGFSESGISRLVNRLEEAGYIARELSRSDRRSTDAVLTDDGAAALDRAARVLAPALRAHLAEPLTPDEVQTLHDLAARIRA